MNFILLLFCSLKNCITLSPSSCAAQVWLFLLKSTSIHMGKTRACFLTGTKEPAGGNAGVLSNGFQIFGCRKTQAKFPLTDGRDPDS